MAGEKRGNAERDFELRLRERAKLPGKEGKGFTIPMSRRHKRSRGKKNQEDLSEEKKTKKETNPQ